MQIIKLATARQAGVLAARIIANRLYAFPDLRLALPTGRTPEPMFQEIRRLSAAQAFPAARASLFQIDEYLGPDAGAMSQELENSLSQVAFAQRFYWSGSDDLLALPAERGQRLDLLVLGLGDNGHIAFIEPGDNADNLAYLSRISKETAQQNDISQQETITIGMTTVNRAREIILLVTGERKGQILARTLQSPITDKCPGSLLQEHQRLTVICDQAASVGLQGLRTTGDGPVVAAIGCSDLDGQYSAAAGQRVLQAAKTAAEVAAPALILSGGARLASNRQRRRSESQAMAEDLARLLPERLTIPIIYEEAADRSSEHAPFIDFLASGLLGRATPEVLLVTSWWHAPRMRRLLIDYPNFTVISAPGLSGMRRQRRLRTEIDGWRWAAADARESQQALAALRRASSGSDLINDGLWELTGSGELSNLSGNYQRSEAQAVCARALEQSSDLFSFDHDLSARSPAGQLLSGSQLLAALSAKD